MITNSNLDEIQSVQTPFYYYNLELLKETLMFLKETSQKNNYSVHYAIKANANRELLKLISSYGYGADCVSGNEVKLAIDTGFKNDKIVFAGVGKTDQEIEFAMENQIFCFHCESVQELVVINQLAAQRNIVVNVALRLNPNISANTHSHITTGLIENKFGLSIQEVNEAKSILHNLLNIKLIGLHFHIGSQITDLSTFKNLAIKINQLQKEFFPVDDFIYLNVGGGLGIDYANPYLTPIPDFNGYFNQFKTNLILKSNQKVHFELGRSIVGQCGSLITRVTFVKGSNSHKFIVADAGMNDLIRPALYGAKHKIVNLSSVGTEYKYDVVGPVCETADCFAKEIELPETRRGDILAILSSGAYGEVMSSQYNLRDKPDAFFSETSAVENR